MGRVASTRAAPGAWAGAARRPVPIATAPTRRRRSTAGVVVASAAAASASASAAAAPSRRAAPRLLVARATAPWSAAAGGDDPATMASKIEQLARENEALRAELNALRAASGLPPLASSPPSASASPFSTAAQGVAAAAEARAAAGVAQAQAQAQAAVAQAQATAAAASAAAAAAVAAAVGGARTAAGARGPAAASPPPTGPAALYAPAPPPPIDVEAEEPGRQQQQQSASSNSSSSSSSDDEDAALLEETLARGVNWPPASTGDAWRAAGGNSMPPADAWFWAAPPRSTPMPLDVSTPAGAPSPPPQDPRPLHIVHLSAELSPAAKVGGLADVVTGLARACSARGHRVQVCLPFYEFLETAAEGVVEGLRHEGDLDVPKGQLRDGRVSIGALPTSVYSATIAGVNVLLVKPAERAHSPLFRGARVYGGSYNETEAYLFFCRACLEWLAKSGAQPDIVHCHDWMAAIAPLLFWERYHVSAGGPFTRSSVVFTIHSLASTGELRADEFAAFLGVDTSFAARFAHVDRALDERTIGHNPERLNLMKGAVVYAAAVTTVSPTYAREILTGGASGWLLPTFTRPDVARKVRGILNGIDYDEWNPATDAFLPATYSSQFPQGKAVCKAFLQRGLGLDVDPSAPLVVAVTRLVPQKGISLLLAAMRRTIELGGQAVILGTGHADGDLRRMADGELSGSGRGRVVLLHSEALAHQLYAAADVVLVPSIFEPCGLTQMIAARYGAVPLVRRTGGLADTVADVDDTPPGWPIAGGGYVFDAPSEDALRGALDRCIARYRERPEAWAELRAANMTANFSWSGSAKAYIDTYNGLCGGVA